MHWPGSGNKTTRITQHGRRLCSPAVEVRKERQIMRQWGFDDIGIVNRHCDPLGIPFQHDQVAGDAQQPRAFPCHLPAAFEGFVIGADEQRAVTEAQPAG